jgi:putative oxidoreductase
MAATHPERAPVGATGFFVNLERATRALMLWLGWVAAFIAPPLARIALAVPFFRSGLTKWSGFLSLSPVADFLFVEQFKLHLFGKAYGFPAPDILAYIDAVAEIALPVLLVIGLATRLSALGLLIMTAVIQLTVPSGWANFHLLWGALAVAIIAMGPGPASLDQVIDRCLESRWRAKAAHQAPPAS